MDRIKTITVSALEEASAEIPPATHAGYEFLRIVGAATVGGIMIEGEYGDIFVDLTNGNSLDTRRGGSDAECIAALRAARKGEKIVL